MEKLFDDNVLGCNTGDDHVSHKSLFLLNNEVTRLLLGTVEDISWEVERTHL